MGNFVKTALPCPCGNSSDAYAIDSDNNGYCFGSCGGKFFKGDQKEAEELDKSLYSFRTYEHRGIYSSTFEKYSVKTKFYDGQPIEVAFPYPNASYKIRSLSAKKFRQQGDTGETPLFGKNVFDKGSKKVITITEGEYDTLAAYQMLGGDSAVVSVRNSSAARKDCITEFDYINSFDKIVINFDSDEVGQAAARAVASLFDFKKVYNLKLERHKDANGYLEAKETKEYYSAWSGTKRYTPDNLLSTMNEFREALKNRREEKLADYPFERLQSMLFGLHRSEVVLIKAMEGVGKTEFFRALEDHVLKTTKHPVGLIHLEEDNGTTLRAMAGYFSETPILHPESNVEDEEVLKILEQIMGKSENRFTLHSSFDVEDEDAFMDNMRFMVAACGAEVVFFDHISWLAAGTGDKGDDERKRLDRIAQRLKLLAKELGFCLVMISHVNDDGQTRGSRYISKAANTVISLDRNKTSEDPVERLKTLIMVEKARLIGAKEGPAGFGIYDEDKLMLVDPMKKGLELPT